MNFRIESSILLQSKSGCTLDSAWLTDNTSDNYLKKAALKAYINS